MCGIGGVIWRAEHPVQRTSGILQGMRDALQHRGPDDSGIFASGDGHIGMMNTRLAIRDLSPAGHMPMRSPDGRLCITYNGEIYNAESLRTDLRRLGYAFSSTSDTEVILAGYQHWGDDVVRQLRGMFAFAIADQTEGVRVLLARDPLGIKPLYYAARSDCFAFASELHALRAAGLISTDIDDAALSAYLQLGSVPAPLTMFRDATALEPGCLMVVDGDLNVRSKSYFELPQPDAAAQLDVTEALRDAVTSHLVADVPVGAFLSGGLDSSAIVALAAQSAPQLTTCTVRFLEADSDESDYARAVARRFDTTHHEITLTVHEMVEELPRIVAALDQPSIDGFNTYFISKAAADAGLKVVLSGLGGDELFGGYPSFRGVPRVIRALKSARAVAPASLAARAVARIGKGDRWRKVADAVRRPVSPASAFLTFRGLFAADETAALLRGDSAFDAVAYVADRADGKGEAGDWVSRAELRTYTTNQLLRDADVMSMCHSLELRVPLLDTRLVQSVLSLPAARRLPGRVPKQLLRDAVANVLPPEVLARHEKRGFAFPMRQWLNDEAAEHLFGWHSSIMDRFDQNAVSQVRERFVKGQAHWARAWSLIVLNQWYARVANA